MKFAAALLSVLLSCGIAAAQEVTPPTFDGGAMKFFRARLVAEAKRLAIEKKYPAAELSEEVVVAFRIDTAGRVERWRFLDNTCSGRDSVELAPVGETTRRLLTEALGNLQGEWQPARRGGRKIGYNQTLRFRLPVETIARAIDPDPLLFLGEDPAKSLYPWMRVRVRYDERFAKVGGRVHIRFFVEPDGGITVDEVVSSPDEKLTKEVLRVLRNSRGKWTPRKVDGMPQRTPYELRIDYINDSAD